MTPEQIYQIVGTSPLVAILIWMLVQKDKQLAYERKCNEELQMRQEKYLLETSDRLLNLSKEMQTTTHNVSSMLSQLTKSNETVLSVIKQRDK